MKFLKKRAIWSNWELGLFKITMTSLGLTLGIYFYEALNDLESLFLTIFIAGSILVVLLWAGKMKA